MKGLGGLRASNSARVGSLSPMLPDLVLETEEEAQVFQCQNLDSHSTLYVKRTRYSGSDLIGYRVRRTLSGFRLLHPGGQRNNDNSSRRRLDAGRTD